MRRVAMLALACLASQASGASCHVSPAGRAGLKVLRLRGGATGTAAFEQALQSNDAGAVSDAVDKILGVKLPRENLRGGERPEPPFRGGARGEAEFRLSQAIESNDPYAFEAAVEDLKCIKNVRKYRTGEWGAKALGRVETVNRLKTAIDNNDPTGIQDAVDDLKCMDDSDEESCSFSG
eukprot:Tamp_25539.p2 GENE.Tamp_25539~~Tamp_25539.p2  ORF type:complete len:179 (-),score=38.03 Tamp_25539:401-937(-)